jgi:hypothetical protein
MSPQPRKSSSSAYFKVISQPIKTLARTQAIPHFLNYPKGQHKCAEMVIKGQCMRRGGWTAELMVEWMAWIAVLQLFKERSVALGCQQLVSWRLFILP